MPSPSHWRSEAIVSSKLSKTTSTLTVFKMVVDRITSKATTRSLIAVLRDQLRYARTRSGPIVAVCAKQTGSSRHVDVRLHPEGLSCPKFKAVMNSRE